ncbi:MAG: fibronectin type III domain-containing protein [Nitriliruptoraceae bacterium]|nr:fibronectin type III domain-containing protein [Nitriliruptoraceae bacterium]
MSTLHGATGRGHRWLAGAMSVAFIIGVAPAAVASDGFSIEGLEPITFTEGGDPVRVAPSATISGSGGFADGFLRFGVAEPRETETLGLVTVESVDTAEGAVSVVGNVIHLGLGNGASKQIATVSSSESGAAGQPLRIDFSAALENSDFSGGTQANGDPVGWTVNRQRVVLDALASRTQQRPVSISGGGPYTISGDGYSFQTDFNYTPAGSHPAWGREGDERTLETPGTYQGWVGSHAGRTHALQLRMSGGWCTPSNQDFAGPHGLTYCSSFGPDAWSSPFEAKADDDLAFDWAAANGSDDYEVYGFLVDTSTDEHHLLMYGRGFQQGWTTASGKIPADGEYRFRFVSGSYDRTGGRLLGASLYIANARVLSTDATDDVATKIARLVTYHDSSLDPAPTLEVTVEARTPSAGDLPTTSVETTVTLVDDPPVLTAPADVVVVNAAETQSHGPVTGHLVAADPEGDPITYALVGGESHVATVAGIDVDQRQVGDTGTLYLGSSTGAYVWVVDESLANATTAPRSETFAVRADAYSVLHDQTLHDDGVLTTRIDIAASAPTAPTGTGVVAGDGTVALSWDAPWWSGGAEEVRYQVDRLVDGSWVTIAVDLATPTLTLTELTNGIEVELRVRATNVHGSSGPSVVQKATPYTVPGTVGDLQVEEQDGRLVVRWAAPVDTGGAVITGYDVVSSHGTCAVKPAEVTGDPRPWFGCTLTSLSNGTATSVTVHAHNAAGSGASATIVGRPYGAPLAPAVTVTPADRQLQVAWTIAPSNGRAVSGYEVLIDGEVRATTAATARSAIIDGLTNGTRTTVAVRGVNLAGPGATGEVAAVPATVPGMPTVHGVSSGNRTLSVSFTAPGVNGGSPVAGYQYSVDGGATWTSIPLVSDTRPLVLRGLQNDTRYEVRLRAFNAMGAGDASPTRAATPLVFAIRPPAPDGSPVFGDGDPDPDTRPAPGTPRVLIDDEPVAAVLRLDGTRLHIEAPGFAIGLRGTEVDGTPMQIDSDGRLVVRRGGMVEVSGYGFAPGSSVDVWLFSEPHLLGVVEVGADGTFAAALALPEGIEPGEHTVQLNGVSVDGALRSASTLVFVAETEPMEDEAAPPERVVAAAERGSTPVSGTTPLPRTGVGSGSLVLLALLGIGLGGSMLRAGGRVRAAPSGRRRR